MNPSQAAFVDMVSIIALVAMACGLVWFIVASVRLRKRTQAEEFDNEPTWLVDNNPLWYRVHEDPNEQELER